MLVGKSWAVRLLVMVDGGNRCWRVWKATIFLDLCFKELIKYERGNEHWILSGQKNSQRLKTTINRPRGSLRTAFN